MAWARFGDTSANHPTVLAVLEHDDADDRIVNELFGFVARCSTQSAAHLTDYVINRGTAIALAGSMARADALLGMAVWAGYMTKEKRALDGREQTVYLIKDDPEFIHLRLREEIEWERQRKRDISNPELTTPARLRDGDGCRYCGRAVSWGNNRNGLGATYDHRHPGMAARSPEDLVVSCRACNAGRGNNPDADLNYPLLPPPTRARFTVSTVRWLKEQDYVRRMGITVPEPTQGMRPGEHAGDGYSRPSPKDPGNGSKPGQACTTSTTTGDGSAAEGEGNGTSGLPTTEAPGPTERGDGSTTGSAHDGESNGSTSGSDRTADNGSMPGPHPTSPGDGSATGQGGTDATESGTADPPGVTDPSGIDQERSVLTDPDQSPDSAGRKRRDGSGRVGTGRDGTGRAGAGAPPGPVPSSALRSTKRTRPRRRR